jgi:hypothetical protein
VLVTVAVVPGAPALVAELMGSAARELDDLRHAADSALSRAVADLIAVTASPAASGPAVAQLVIVGAGETGEFKASGPVSFGSFGRDVLVPALAEGGGSDPYLPTPLMVAGYLASRDVAAHPDRARLWAAARWVTTTGANARALGERLHQDSTLIGLVLVADGAACHGPKAPRAEDSRAKAYDDGVWAALASGRPGRLAEIPADLGLELEATGAQVWPVLLASDDSYWVGEVLWSGAPYGVGWAVASWRQAPTSATATTP